MKPRILFLDVETAPISAFCWGLFDQRIALNQIIDTSKVLCWAAQWAGEKKMHFDSINETSEKHMLKGIHRMLDEADIVCTYNGINFDYPQLQRSFLLAGMPPPSPVKHVDLLRIVRKNFRFDSRKLDHVCEQLGLGHKTRHPGFEMWVKVMNKDPVACKVMKKYNIQDVKLLAALYKRLMPWIDGHPNVGSYIDDAVCPKCGSSEMQRRGTAVSAKGRYPRYQCKCGGWARGPVLETKATKKRLVAL